MPFCAVWSACACIAGLVVARLWFATPRAVRVRVWDETALRILRLRQRGHKGNMV